MPDYCIFKTPKNFQNFRADHRAVAKTLVVSRDLLLQHPKGKGVQETPEGPPRIHRTSYQRSKRTKTKPEKNRRSTREGGGRCWDQKKTSLFGSSAGGIRK